MDRRSADRRRRIVDAATALFSRYGFKRTSVDLLAAEAGVAKPTVYAYFTDKDAVFRAVVEAVCDDLLAAATEASRADAPLEERLAAMLSAKLTRHWELVHASPHARELLDSQGRLGAEAIARFDRAFARLLASTLEKARGLHLARLGLGAPAAAALLLRAASGAGYDATSAAAHRRQLGEIVRIVVAGLRAA